MEELPSNFKGNIGACHMHPPAAFPTVVPSPVVVPQSHIYNYLASGKIMVTAHWMMMLGIP
jgi:hypothetical protein